jgi:hypothetical protein
VTDVFLSYARADDEPFAALVHRSLTDAGMSVWWDRRSMPSRGLAFLREIRDAISRSDRVVVVVGPAALRSDYVRAEWQHALAEAKPITPVLRLGEFAGLPAELRPLHCIDCRAAAQDRGLIELRRAMSERLPPLGAVVGAVPPSPPHFQPRPDDLESLARTLLVEEREPVTGPDSERITVVHGMGGIGKTVLAASFARSTSTRRAFSDGVVWVTANPDADEADVVAQVAALATHAPAVAHSLAEDVSRLREALAERRMLIVVDDAWRVAQLELLAWVLGPRCRLMVTTRNAGLAIGLGARELGVAMVRDDEARRLLADWAGVESGEAGVDLATLAAQCAGLPLALALNGAMLAEGAAPADLTAALRAADLTFAETDLRGYAHPTIVRSLDVSVDMLARQDPDAVERYRELAAFMGNDGIPEAAVVAFWQQRARLDARHGRRLLERLQQRSLLRLEGAAPAPRRIRLHDIVRGYLAATAPERLNEALLAAYRAQCSGDWPTGPDDGYFHEHLVAHLLAAGEDAEVHRLHALETPAGRSAWYEARDRIGEFDGYAADVRAAAGVARSFALQARYALISASLNNLARRMPADLLGLLLAQGSTRWTAASALDRVRHGEDEEEIAESLSALAPHLPVTALAEALAIARSIRDEAHLVRVLGALGARPMRDSDAAAAAATEAVMEALEPLAPEARLDALLTMGGEPAALEGPRQWVAEAALRTAEGSGLATVAVADAFGITPAEEAVDAALAEVEHIEDHRSRVRVRLAVIDHVGEQRRSAVVEAALADADQIHYRNRRALAIGWVLPLLAPERRRALAEELSVSVGSSFDDGPAALVMLAASLGDTEREQALERAVNAAAAQDFDSWTTSEFEAMLDQAWGLESADRARLLHKLLNAAGRMTNPYWQARTIARVSAQTAELDDPEASAVLAGALAQAERIEEQEFRARALAAVALHAPEPQRAAIVALSLSAADRIGDEPTQSVVYCALAESATGLRERLHEAALAATARIEPPQWRALALTELATRVGDTERIIAALAQIDDGWTRGRALVHLAAVLLEPGQRDAVAPAIAAAQAIEDNDARAHALKQLALVADAAAGRLPAGSRLVHDFLGIRLDTAPEASPAHEPAPVPELLALRLAEALKDPYRHDRHAAGDALELLRRAGAGHGALDDLREWLTDESVTARAYAAAAAALGVRERQHAVAVATDAIARIRDPRAREHALEALLPLASDLKGPLAEQVLDASLAVAGRHRSETRRGKALVLVGRAAPQPRRARLLRDALAAARAADTRDTVDPRDTLTMALAADYRGRSEVVAAVASAVDGLTAQERTAALADALAVAREIDNDYRCARALLAVAEAVPPAALADLLREALRHIEKMTNDKVPSDPDALQPESAVERCRAELLGTIGALLARVEPRDFAVVWHEIAGVLVLCSRDTAMSALATVALSCEPPAGDVVDDSARAVLDVCRWFP